jgi:hypothetical protein
MDRTQTAADEQIQREIMRIVGEMIRDKFVNEPIPDKLFRLITELDRRNGHC